MRALTPVARVRTRALAARRPQQRREDRRPPRRRDARAACAAASPPPPSAATTATSSGSTRCSPNAEPARGDRPARRRGDRRRRRRPGGHERQAQRRRSTPTRPANAAAAKSSPACSRSIGENLPGTLDDVDSEFLHDLRVAVRRTRRLQRQFKAIYPDAAAALPRRVQAPAGASPATCATSTSTCSTSTSCRPRCRSRCAPTSTPLRGLLVDPPRAGADRHAPRAEGPAHRATRSSEWLDVRRTSVPTAERTVARLASHRIARVYRKMVKMGKAIDDDSPAEDLHELRKVGKELRYLLEFFASLYPRRGRQAVREDAQGPAGPARPLPGPRGPGQRAARRSRPTSSEPRRR